MICMHFPVWPNENRWIPSIWIPKHGRRHSCISILQLRSCIISRQWPTFFEGGAGAVMKSSRRISSCEMWYNRSIIRWICLVDFQMRPCVSFQTVAWIFWEWPGSVMTNSNRIDNYRVRRRIRLPSRYLRKTDGSRFTCLNPNPIYFGSVIITTKAIT